MTIQDAGTLTHANDYLSPNLSQWNRVGYASSADRLQRINELMDKETKEKGKLDFSLNDFKTFSQDTLHSPQNSLWRTAEQEDRERTVASFIVDLQSQSGSVQPYIYIKLAPLGGKITEVQGTFKELMEEF
jgi:hypothetical protein